MNARQAATVKAKALYQQLREQYIEGDQREELIEVVFGGEGAFVAANLARFDGEPEAEPVPVEQLEPRLLGHERDVLWIAP